MSVKLGRKLPRSCLASEGKVEVIQSLTIRMRLLVTANLRCERISLAGSLSFVTLVWAMPLLPALLLHQPVPFALLSMLLILIPTLFLVHDLVTHGFVPDLEHLGLVLDL